MRVAEPVGHWWLAYDDQTLWPCEVVAPAIAGQWLVEPIAPAPDAGKRRLEPRGRIYDSDGNYPRMVVE